MIRLFFFLSLLIAFSLPSLAFPLSHYHLFNLNPGLNGDRTISRGTIKIRNFRKKDLMRGRSFGRRNRKLERNEGKTKKLNIRISTVAVEGKLLRETQMVCILQNKNKQEVTGPEPPLPFIPFSNVNWKKN